MQIKLLSTPSVQTLIIPIRQNEVLEKTLSALAPSLNLSAESLLADFKAENKEAQVFYGENRKTILLGLGKIDNSAEVIKAFRLFFNQQKAKLSAQIGIDASDLPIEWIEYIVNGTLLGSYLVGLYKTEAKKESLFFGKDGILDILVKPENLETAQKLAKKGEAIAETQMQIFDLMNAPANKKYPQVLADWAVASGKKYGYSVTVFDEKELKNLGWKALLAVSKGSEKPPVGIILEYKPENATKKVGLVGKGVTFDTGGISIKDSSNMHLMKSDMGGAAAVLGTIELAAKLQLPVHIIGIIPSTENTVDGNAMKPGDVIGSYSGKTIEVIDTDAEGRLILADGLGYMVKNYNPDVLIDLATLTGSVIGTLGYHAAGLFTNNDDLAKTLAQAADHTGERTWRLPLWDAYKDELTSDVADVKNYHGKAFAGAIVAAKFLEVFTEKHPAWVHLDIAGTAFGDTEFAPGKAGTAFGVRLLLEYLAKL